MSVLPESYTFDREKLIEPIRKASILRSMGIPITTSAKDTEKTTKITTVVDDPKIGIAPEPIAGVRSTNTMTQKMVDIPMISAPVSYGIDELDQINDGKLPFDRRMEILMKWFADREEAHAFAKTTAGVRDSDSIPFIQGGTSVSDFDLETGDLALVGLNIQIATLITRYGSLKTRPLILAFNSVAYSRALGLTSSKTDKTFLDMAQEQLVMHGGAGSGIVLLTHLGNALTVNDDVMVITDSTDETMALMLIDSNHFEIIASPITPRADPVSPRTGLKVDIVERWLPYVHDALAILYQMNVDIS